MQLRRRALLTLIVPASALSAAGLGVPLPAHAAPPSLALTHSYTETLAPGNNSPANYSVTQPFAGVAVGDVFGNGQQKVVAAFPDGNVVLLNSGLGVDNGAWPRSAGPGPAHASPTLADLDGSGRMQIIETSDSGIVNVWNGDGTSYPGWPQTSHPLASNFPPGFFSGVAVGDLFGNGTKQLVAGSWDHTLYAWDRNGHVLGGFPINLYDTIWDSPTLADMEHLGQMDILIGSDSAGGSSEPYPPGGVYWSFRPNGTRLPWTQTTDQVPWASTAVADLHNTRSNTIVGGSGINFPDPKGHYVNAWGEDGSHQWTGSTGGRNFASPAIGHLQGAAGAQQVVENSQDGAVYVWDANGTLLWSRSLGLGNLFGSPIIAPVDGSGNNGVWVGAGNHLMAFDAAGNTVSDTIVAGGIWSTPTVASLDGNTLSVIVTSQGGTGNPQYETHWVVSQYQIPGSSASMLDPVGKKQWPTFHYNMQRTGNNLGKLGPPPPPAPGVPGYWMTASDGGIFNFNVPYYGSMGGTILNQPIAGMARTKDGGGYWEVATDGGIFSFGDATFYGSTGNIRLNQPIVGMARTPSGNGYWMVASDGGVFSFGDAVFRGSTGNIRLNQPIVGMASTPSGLGYWLVARDGGIFSFGDAVFYGSTGNIHLNQPVVGMAAVPGGGGYWMVASDGGIFSFGSAAFHGSTGNIHLNQPIVGMAPTASGNGYWMAASDGGIFTFGDAVYLGSTGNIRLNQPVKAMASWG